MRPRYRSLVCQTVMMNWVVAPGTYGYQFVLIPNLSHFWTQTCYFPARIKQQEKQQNHMPPGLQSVMYQFSIKQTDGDDFISSDGRKYPNNDIYENRFNSSVFPRHRHLLPWTMDIQHFETISFSPWFSWRVFNGDETSYVPKVFAFLSCPWMSHFAIFFTTFPFTNLKFSCWTPRILSALPR